MFALLNIETLDSADPYVPITIAPAKVVLYAGTGLPPVLERFGLATFALKNDAPLGHHWCVERTLQKKIDKVLHQLR